MVLTMKERPYTFIILDFFMEFKMLTDGTLGFATMSVSFSLINYVYHRAAKYTKGSKLLHGF